MLGVTACSGSYPQSTLNPASDFGVSIDNLFTGIFWWAVFVFVVVEGLLIITIVRFRARPGRPKPKFIHGHTALEIGWTLAPAVILVFIAVPTIQTIFRHDGTAPDDALQVEVVGHQWWWEFKYPEYGIVTATELHVARGRPVPSCPPESGILIIEPWRDADKSQEIAAPAVLFAAPLECCRFARRNSVFGIVPAVDA